MALYYHPLRPPFHHDPFAFGHHRLLLVFAAKPLHDQKQLKQSQAKMKEFQKVYREAQLAGDKGKLKKLEKERAEVMELSMDVQAQTMRPMPYILVISLPLFGWLSYIMSQMGSWPKQVSPNIACPILEHCNTLKASSWFSCLAYLVPNLYTGLHSSYSQDVGNVTAGNAIKAQQVSCQFSRTLSPLSSKGL